MYVWYVGYGSNLFRDRFICYILGGQFRWGGSYAKGCKDKTLPKEDRPFIIPHGLYFAKNSSSWENGGVAFISPERDENRHTYGRMWKITEEQYSDIWDQEGKVWYNIEVDLGQAEDGTPIRTITNNSKLKFSKPSDEYLKTIIAGLRETYHLNDKIMLKYLMETSGIKDNVKEEEITALFC